LGGVSRFCLARKQRMRARNRQQEGIMPGGSGRVCSAHRLAGYFGFIALGPPAGMGTTSLPSRGIGLRRGARGPKRVASRLGSPSRALCPTRSGAPDQRQTARDRHLPDADPVMAVRRTMHDGRFCGRLRSALAAVSNPLVAEMRQTRASTEAESNGNSTEHKGEERGAGSGSRCWARIRMPISKA
jgi:hypothetical protein